MNLNRLRIGQRLALDFGVVTTLLVLLAGLSTLRISSLTGEINHMVNDRYPKTVVANKIKADLDESIRSMLNVLIMQDAGQVKKELSNIEERNKSLDASIDRLNTIITDDKGKEQVEAIGELRDKFLPAQNKFVALVQVTPAVPVPKASMVLPLPLKPNVPSKPTVRMASAVNSNDGWEEF